MPSPTIVLDPKTQWFLKFLESMGRPQIFEVPVAEAREMYAKGNAMVPVVKQPAQIEDRTISVDPGPFQALLTQHRQRKAPHLSAGRKYQPAAGGDVFSRWRMGTGRRRHL